MQDGGAGARRAREGGLRSPISPRHLPHISPISPAYLAHVSQVVYATLFDYIVNRVNDVSRGPEGSSVIGILDIFGFENLTTNSFEQLCINYVNEMLQEQFNETVFAAERRLLKAEGIEIDDGALQS